MSTLRLQYSFLLLAMVAALEARPVRILANRFDYTGPEGRRWLIAALQVVLNHNLSRIAELEVPSYEDYAKVLQLRTELAAQSEQERSRALAIILNLDYILNGQLHQDAAGNLKLQIQLTRGRQARVLDAFALKGHVDGPEELMLQIAEKVLLRLATQERLPLLEKNAVLFGRRPYKRQKALRLLGQGLADWQGIKSPDAHNHWAAAVAIEKDFHLARLWLARSFLARNQMKEALGQYTEALQRLANDSEQDRFEAQLYAHQSDVYRAIQDYDRALTGLQRARDLLQKLGLATSDQAAEVANSTGEILLAQGQLEAALPEFYRAKVIKDELNLSVTYNYARVLNNIATTLFAQGKFNNALAFYLNELTIKDAMELQNTIAYADTLTNLGVVYMNLKQFRQAQDRYAQSMELRKKLGDSSSRGYADTLFNVGYYKILSGDFCGAMSWLDAGVSKTFAINPAIAYERVAVYNLARDGCRS